MEEIGGDATKGNEEHPQVAVVGMSCRAPKSDSVEEFWNNLMGKVDMISLSTSRWPVNVFNLPSRIGVVNNITKLDAEFFSMTAEEALQMDPQLRMLMEVAAEAVLDSGIDPKVLTEKSTGVYTAVLKSEVQALGNNIEVCSTAMFPCQLSKFFGFNGPSLVIDCACSSALVAIAVAVTDLLHGRADFALVAGCSLLLSPNQSVQNLKLGMLSKDGTCRSWDAAASGYVRSEGIYCILLARNCVEIPRIYANIISVGNNSDGFKNEGITFPSSQAQIDLLQKVYRAQVDIALNAYNECHATGTQAGDPEEANALAEVLSNAEVCSSLLVGTCKSNLGHTEWAAGLASFMKAVLCIMHKRIPPNMHLIQTNSKINSITEGILEPVTEPRQLPDGNVGVSAMGFGGSNCHVVLQPPLQPKDPQMPDQLLLLFGSRTKAGLTELKKIVRKKQNCPATLSHITRAFTFPKISSKLQYRQAMVLSKCEDGYTKVEFDESSHLHKASSLQLETAIWLIIHDVATTEGYPHLTNGLEVPSQWLKDQDINKMWLEDAWQHQLVRNAVLVLSTMNVLKLCEMQIKGVIGVGLSEVVAGVFDGCFNEARAIKIMAVIAEFLSNAELDVKEFKSLEVYATFDKMCRLCEQVHVISYNHHNCITVSGSEDAIERLKKSLQVAGINYQEVVLVHSHLYTSALQTCQKGLLSELKAVMVPPLVRSQNWVTTKVATTYSTNYLQLESVTSEFFSSLVHSTTHLMGAVAQVPTGVQQLHLGIGPRPLWLSDIDIYIDASESSSMLSALGKLYLKGIFVNTSNLQLQSFPAVSSPIGHLMRWDHAATWPVPHWLQFCSSIHSERINRKRSLPWDGTSATLVHSIYQQILNYIPATKEAVGLYNLSPMDVTADIQPSIINVQVFLGTQRFVASKDGEVLCQGEYSVEHNPNLQGIKVGPEIAPVRHLRTWPVKWVGSLALYLQAILDHLIAFSEEESNTKLELLSVKCQRNAMPKSQDVCMSYEPKTGLCNCDGISIVTSPMIPSREDTSFNGNLTSQIYPFASSNITTPAPQEEVTLGAISIIMSQLDTSGIPDGSSEFCEQRIEVHAIKLYRVKGSELHPSQVLVYCGCVAKRHVFGISLLSKSNTTQLMKPTVVPPEFSCATVVSILIPYLLAHSILKSSLKDGLHMEMDRTFVVVAHKSDVLLRCLLAMVTPIGKNIYVCIKNGLTTPEILIPQMEITCSTNLHTYQNISSKSAPAILLTNAKETVNVTTPTDCNEGSFQGFQTSTPDNRNPPSKLLMEAKTASLNGQELSTNATPTHVHEQTQSPVTNLLLKLPSNSAISGNSIAELNTKSDTKSEELNWLQVQAPHQNSTSIKSPAPNLTIMKWGVNASLTIQKAMKNEGVTNIISMDSVLSDWTDLMKVDGSLVHIGPVQAEVKFGIGICSTFGSVQFINSSEALKEACLHLRFYPSPSVSSIGSESFNEDTNSILNPSVSEMATVLARIGITNLNEPETTTVYECTGSAIFLFPVSLNVVHKHIQKIASNSSKRISLENYDWLGKLKHLSSTSMFKSINANLQQFHVRPCTPVPRVHSITPEEERNCSQFTTEYVTGENKFLDMDYSESAPSALYTIKAAAPLSRSTLPTIVSMNDVVFGQPVILVHPITGVLNTLRHLGSKLPYPCFGIQQTAAAPMNSMSSLARFYLENCKEITGAFPLRLIGYSYGACVALAMALEAQSQGLEVKSLIFLDGSPQYITEPLRIIRESYPSSEVEQVMETEMLLAFLQLYGDVDPINIRPILLQALSTEDRVNVAVNYLEHGRRTSGSPWCIAARRVMECQQPQMYTTIGTLMFKQRVNKAKAFLSNMDLVDKWIPSKKYQGDAFLFRIGSVPKHCPSLQEDYGINTHISGNLHITKYEASHESIVGPNSCYMLVQDIVSALNHT